MFFCLQSHKPTSGTTSSVLGQEGDSSHFPRVDSSFVTDFWHGEWRSVAAIYYKKRFAFALDCGAQGDIVIRNNSHSIFDHVGVANQCLPADAVMSKAMIGSYNYRRLLYPASFLMDIG